MRAISKQREPNELINYRRYKDAKYDGPEFTSVKAKIREQLLVEQGYLCAYCMRRIEEATAKIEHWHSQNEYPDEQLHYPNLLAVCYGNDLGEPTCDTKKRNAELKYNPANLQDRIEEQIRYLGNGGIVSNDREFNEQLQKVLNLNYSRLQNNRKNILDAVNKALNFKPGIRNSNEIKKLIQRWEKPTEGKLPEYCAVAIYFLRKKI